MDGTLARDDFNVLAYGVNVKPNQCAYDGSTIVDYELIVPVNNSGLQNTQTYFFFLDIE